MDKKNWSISKKNLYNSHSWINTKTYNISSYMKQNTKNVIIITIRIKKKHETILHPSLHFDLIAPSSSSASRGASLGAFSGRTSTKRLTGSAVSLGGAVAWWILFHLFNFCFLALLFWGFVVGPLRSYLHKIS